METAVSRLSESPAYTGSTPAARCVESPRPVLRCDCRIGRKVPDCDPARAGTAAISAAKHNACLCPRPIGGERRGEYNLLATCAVHGRTIRIAIFPLGFIESRGSTQRHLRRAGMERRPPRRSRDSPTTGERRCHFWPVALRKYSTDPEPGGACRTVPRDRYSALVTRQERPLRRNTVQDATGQPRYRVPAGSAWVRIERSACGHS